MCGGLLEYNALYLGYSALYLIAAAIYLLILVAPHPTRPWERGEFGQSS